MNIGKITNFIFELNQLKRQKHSGWQLAGVRFPDSVASHSLRAAQIGYILAIMEGSVNPERIAVMLMIHDNPETRTGDQDKIAAGYSDKQGAEKMAFDDQVRGLGKIVEQRWKKYYREFEDRNTREGIIAKDADWLETAFQARQYINLGYNSAKNWFDNIETALETESAKRLLKEIKRKRFTDWWQGLKKMTYKKL